MKILKLRALNINSLKGKIEIDFEKFLDNNSAIFAITGATGSGKSTLLDIISCALYGHTPRLKNPSDLISKGTGEAYCEVEFEIKNERYRAYWSQRRARDKSDGKLQPPKMELSSLKSGEILMTGVRDVPNFIEDISGLDFGKFTKSMMLAQGSFDAFLKAKESDRAELLEKITGTVIYTDISKKVFEKHKIQETELKVKEKLLENIDILDRDIEEITKKLIVDKREERGILDLKVQELDRDIQWAKTLNILEDEKIKYERELIVLEGERDKKRDDFIRLDRAKKALSIIPIYTQFEELNLQLTKEREKSTAIVDDLDNLDTQKVEIGSRYNLISSRYKDEKIIFERELQKIKDAKEIDIKIAEIESSTIEIERNISLKEREKLSIEGEIVKIKDRIIEIKEDKKEILDEVESLEGHFREIDERYQKVQNDYKKDATKEPELRERISKLEIELRDKDRLKSIKDEIKEDKKLKKSLKGDVKHLVAVISNLKDDIEILRENQKQALLIQKYEDDRARLTAGEPCFLCGSKKHPFVKHIEKIPKDKISAKLEKREKSLEIEEITLKSKDEELAVIISRLDSNIREMADIQESKDSRRELEDNIKSIDKRLNKIIKRRESREELVRSRDNLNRELQEKRERVSSISNNLVQTEERLNSLTLREDKSNIELNELKIKLSDIKERVESLSNAQRDILDVDNLKIYEDEITLKYNSLQKDERDTNILLQEVYLKHKEKKEQLEEIGEDIDKNSERLESLLKKLNSSIDRSIFDNIDDFLKAIVPAKDIDILERVCSTLSDNISRLNSLKMESEKRLADHKKVEKSNIDLKSAEDEYKRLKEKLDSLQLSIGKQEQTLEQNIKNKIKHREKIDELNREREEFKVCQKMKELIGSANGAKFARFAQSITLEQLIQLANSHLNILNQRYILIYNKEENQESLDISIIDTFQADTVRAVSTLSGGESFIISLALALGLSELASQKISIESLFLDEGFGTLDEENLEMAINALNTLQSKGKMVGVISHIEALKERIPIQIKVIANGDGTSRVEI